MKQASEWLISQNKFHRDARAPGRRAHTVSITGGKGGVGKTSIAIKMARMLSQRDFKVLLIDCDTNLSNTAVKLGLPLNDHFMDLVTARKSFEECLYIDGNFHLLSACNGNLDLFERNLEFDRLLIDVVSAHEREYDFILLDCPAGLSKTSMTLNAYSDQRIIVATPDRASITDSYSLMKILNTKYGVNENHLLVNKVSTLSQYQRMVKTLGETVENFLTARLKVLGFVALERGAVDRFDQELLGGANSALERDFAKVLSRFTEETIGANVSAQGSTRPYMSNKVREQDVQPAIC
ncbi:MAG: hypothetical protein CME71_04530 [Halobacteriovorax sp.]|nr:hypothetical protein [Halobacteriovorax sp.]